MKKPDKRYKLLLIAPGASDTDVGECYLAYKWIEQLSTHFDVTVLTLKLSDKLSIKSKNPNFVNIEFQDSGLFSKFERFSSMFKPWYISFYFKARRWIKQHGNEFDWAHQLNPFAMRYPTPLQGLSIPFSFGPMAGGLEDLSSFKQEMGSMAWYTQFRRLDNFRAKFDPLLGRGYRDANFIVVAAPYVADTLRYRYPQYPMKLLILDEHAVEGVHLRERGFNIGKDTKLRLLFVGRIVRTKGVRDLIRALNYLDFENYHLDVIGDGDDLRFCISEAQSMCLDDKITFHGKLARDAVDSFYQSSDLMVFPSFREPSGGVVIEAMANGLPQLVCDHGGPGASVKKSFGKKVPISDPTNYPQDIAAEINEINLDRSVLKGMSEGSISYCRQNYLWQSKIEFFAGHLRSHIDKSKNTNIEST